MDLWSLGATWDPNTHPYPTPTLPLTLTRSLGAILAELLTGYVLFQNDSVPRLGLG